MICRLAQPAEHDDLLNYRLKRLVNVGGAPAIRLCEGRYGITRSEWRVLAALVEGGPRTPSELAERAFVQRPVASRLLGMLVRKRLVRHLPPGSARVRAAVEATAAGRRLYGELFPQLALINQRLMAALDDDEACQLEVLLDKLWQRARQIHAEGGGVEVRADRRHGGSRRRWEADNGQSL